ncbi:hypothetical protein NONO_c52590 [Nocardia nova SH22a]|uniref:Uncharacterized protein n=1 Tax=Nocardia nova SH22a TaxID=1415166 RepID=W5TLM2_9NOCA|nr:hypothetical protein [Nocardia nova]AHH20039.1 hypothetical protein NONO_c52590 [Nocardia nova SH22a]
MHFSLDPLAADADISVLVAGKPVAHLGRLRRLDRLTVLRRPSDYEGVQLWFADAHEPPTLQTKPGILLSWDVRALGEW